MTDDPKNAGGPVSPGPADSHPSIPSNDNPILAAALALAARGVPVFPVFEAVFLDGQPAICACRVPSCKHVAKHPRTAHGFKDATTDEVVIRGWWGKWSNANLGIATGAVSSLVVLDVDPRHQGDARLAELVAKHGPLPATPTVKTGGGGNHFYFSHPGVKVKSVEVVHGLDSKADGGYIIAPPSVHASTNAYEWAPGLSLSDISLAPAPEWLLEMIRGSSAGKKGKLVESKGHMEVSEGTRNSTLTSFAGRLRRRGKNEEEIVAELEAFNREKVKPPLSGDELRSIAQSVAKYPVNAEIPYRITAKGMEYDKPTREGSVPVRITNFTARIVADIIEDDGAETVRRFEIEGKMAGTSIVTSLLLAEKFTAMSWPVEVLGASAVVFPGYSGESHARAAIQLLSGSVPPKRVFGHTGWREIDSRWVYLPAGGGIDKEGVVQDAHVALTGALAGFVLPAPPVGADLAVSVRGLLRVISIGPRTTTFSVLAAVFRSVLGGADFSLFLMGPTGVLKSELAALAQRCFGAGLDARHLPGSWSSTANSLEDMAFRAKDAIFVVDDFKPSGDAIGDARMHQQADRLLRNQGNGAGRGRLKGDGTQRPARPPRGLILITGEDIPRGESLRARILIQEIADGDIDLGLLTHCQKDGDDGVYAAVTAAFCQWTAANLPQLRTEWKARAATLRAKFAGGHKRQPNILADLQAAFEFFVQFIRETTGDTVLTATTADSLVAECKTALNEAGKAQSRFQKAAEPTSRFMELFSSAISSGRAHIASVDGDEPSNSGAWGWCREQVGDKTVVRAYGDRVGWVEDDDLYLDPRLRIGRRCRRLRKAMASRSARTRCGSGSTKGGF